MFNTIEQALIAIKEGKMIIVVDDEDRENEGDLVMAADKVTPEAVNFMARYGRGLICVPLTAERVSALGLSPMVADEQQSARCQFTVSVDGKLGTTTGISATDRARTIRALIDQTSRPNDFFRPGHVFPLIAKAGGVLVRAGHTEAAVDLARLAGCVPAGVICEITRDDGEMARVPDLFAFALEHHLPMITIQDIIRHRRRTEKLIERQATADLPTTFGNFTVHIYTSRVDAKEHVALVMGDVASGGPSLVRVHSECLTGDVFGSSRCDCGAQLEGALQQIAATGRGVILYMRQEGRGIGLTNKIRAYHLQQTEGLDTVEANVRLGLPADLREYGIGAQILTDLGVKEIRLLTNNPKKVIGLSGFELSIIEQVPLEIAPNTHNRFYLETKKIKLGHVLNLKIQDTNPKIQTNHNGEI